jgi:hypothetical protein
MVLGPLVGNGVPVVTVHGVTVHGVTVHGVAVILSAAKDLRRECEATEILHCAQDDRGFADP